MYQVPDIGLFYKKKDTDADKSVIIFSRKDLKLIWATFGNRESNINFVLSYGQNHMVKDRSNNTFTDKCVHVLDLAFSIRPKKKSLTGAGNSFPHDCVDSGVTEHYLQLLTCKDKACIKFSSVFMLLPPALLKYIQENLKCISIGLKCIIPPDNDVPPNSLRFCNKSARDMLKKEINQCFEDGLENDL